MSKLMKHAPEPWSVSALGNGIHAGDISICQFYNRFGTDFPNFEANARRIVACVNACEGLSTERLEKFLGSAANKSVITLTTDNLDLKDRIAELEHQQAELVGAANAVLDCDGSRGTYDVVELAKSRTRLNAALAAVKPAGQEGGAK